MKRKIALALAMIMAAVSLTACGGGGAASAPAASGGAAASAPAAEEVWTIGFANRDDADVYLKAVQVAFKELVDADPALEGLYADCATDSQLQLDQIDNFLVQGVDALVLVPQDGATVVDIVEQCNEDGMPVFCSSQASSGGEFVFVGASDYETGLLEGEWCYENLEEGAKILYLGGDLGYQTSIDRRQGLVDGLKDRIKADWDGNVLNENGDIEILSWQLTMYTMEDGMRITEDWIQTFDDFDCIVSVNDSTGLGAIEALKAAGINDCTIVSIDGVPDALNAVKEGTMDVTIMQSAERQAECLYEAIKTAQAGGENPAV
ncbi:MAG: sugar ABC transporter substrate-binding protein, partial [Butyricicoccus sp.]|nr:sugar ABC transporter substrate-binding protein [Butyricicoccus sp.]